VHLVDVGGEDLGLADAAVHCPREDEGVVAEHVGQGDRGAAEDPSPEVVALVPDGRPRDVVGAEADVVNQVATTQLVRDCQALALWWLIESCLSKNEKEET